MVFGQKALSIDCIRPLSHVPWLCEQYVAATNDREGTLNDFYSIKSKFGLKRHSNFGNSGGPPGNQKFF